MASGIVHLITTRRRGTFIRYHSQTWKGYWLLRALINIFTSDWYALPTYLDCRCLIRMSKTSAAKKLYNTSKRQQKLRKTYVFGTKALTFIELSTLKNKTPNLKGLKGQPKICEKKNAFLGSPFETSSFLPSCYASIVGWLVGHRYLLAETVAVWCCNLGYSLGTSSRPTELIMLRSRDLYTTWKVDG